MRLVTAFETTEPTIDHVIVWDDDVRLIAYAYQAGQVTRTTPLQTTDPRNAAAEARRAFGITTAQQWPQAQGVAWPTA